MSEKGPNLEIRVEPLGGSRLVADYYTRSAALAPFFAGSPWDVAAYRRKLEDVDRRFDAEARRSLGDALRTTSAASAAALAQLASGDAVVVTTGQQAGLFTGPLYTVYKILSAVQLARTLTPVLGRSVLPLFWVASDDHDWHEINHAHVLDAANELRRVDIADADPRALPAGERVLGPAVTQAIQDLEAALPPTEFTPPLLEAVRAAYTPERSAADAFAGLIAALFADFDLLIVDPRHPELKRRSARLLAHELAHAAEHERRLASQTARLVAAGYHAQVSVLPGEANVFYESAVGRERIVRVDGGWQLKSSGERTSDDDLRARLEREPARFSPNVFLRPVVESALLPTIAYVGGPAELGYFAQIGCLFDAHDVGMPVLFPRFGVTLLENKVRKVLEKHRLDVDDFQKPVQEVTARVVRDEIPAAVTEALEALRAGWTEGFEALQRAATPIDASLKGPLQSARNSGFMQLGEAEKKIAQSAKRQDATTIEQIEKAAVNLFPLGTRQERVLNVTQYLARYGNELLPAIAERMQVRLEVDEPVWAGVQCG